MRRWRRGERPADPTVPGMPDAEPTPGGRSRSDASPEADRVVGDGGTAGPAPRPAVVVIGAINVDLVFFTSQFPGPGETVLGRRFERHHGGKGGNQAVAVARALRGGRLEGSVALVGVVGGDEFGREALEALRAEGVDCSAVVRRKGVSTGVAGIMVDASGANMIALAPGANATLAPSEVEAALSPLVGPETVLLASLEVPIDGVLAAGYVAATAGARFILNPAPADGVPSALIHLARYLTPNEVELDWLVPGATGQPQVQARELQAADRGLYVAVTLGADGVFASGPDAEGMFRALDVDVTDTTGAGDAFNGAFAAALAEGRPFLDAARRGRTAGSLATTRAGAREAMPTRSEIDAAREPR